MSAPTITLKPNGAKMPQVGFGLWKVTEDTANVVYNALKSGYRLLDGACDYGMSTELGSTVQSTDSEKATRSSAARA